ncbi:MAG: glycogen/starch/alpha-glucan phosphorylase [Oscillospiraceae bacterium]|jgi:starch phosphorylase|nr:glycogen/starch/alpha-glucan phosphorylase [Oscillospiraceae bacterium]
MAVTFAQKKMAEELVDKLHHHFGREAADATKTQIFKACALLVRDRMSAGLVAQTEDQTRRDARQVHYLSLEFLLGRSLMKNAYNLGILDDMSGALKTLGYDPNDIFEAEADAGLGNGGLGRLAACYLDSMTTLGIPATGYSICYHYGIFRQKIIEGEQVELPDPWLETGDVWLMPRLDEAEEVRFGGRVETAWEDGRMRPVQTDYTSVLAIPMDMSIAGYETTQVNTLRLWNAKSPVQFDMSLFARGEYLRAVEQNALAEVISKVLYPEDNHFEGKMLRLRQQYFFVSATVQSVVRAHKARFGTLKDFHLRHVFQINDTHPTLVIPELMRILLDEEGMDWDEAWGIVTHSVAYTNHTILSEALERWPQQALEMLLPRIWQLLCEINNRLLTHLREDLSYSQEQCADNAVVWNGEVRMANLCVSACFAVNGVSALHSRILREDIFADAYRRAPEKFFNVTNGVDHRRWLAQVNPELHALIRDLCGDRYLTRPNDLHQLGRFENNPAVLAQLAVIKRRNKERMAKYIYDTAGVLVDPASLFDVQVKRLHEYKRQLLNVLHIIRLYNQLRDNPKLDVVPTTFLFGAKAASGYYIAKRIIRLIGSLAQQINSDKTVGDRLKVVFLENYRVSLAELLMPAAELSEQISTAGKEASGTGNMKFMFNGALTMGTLDGANVEMTEAVGEDNIFLFGLRAPEVESLVKSGYEPMQYYNQNPELRRVIDHVSQGFSDGVAYNDISSSLLLRDTYLLLADFDSYGKARARVSAAYRDQEHWNRMSLRNIAAAGHFSADRSVAQYAKYIWGINTGLKPENR